MTELPVASHPDQTTPRGDLPQPSTEGDDLARALTAAVYSRDRALAALLRWRVGAVDTEVIRLTINASDWVAAAWTGQLFSRWHSGRAQPRTGKSGRGLGAALRGIGGPTDPAAQRMLRRLIDTGTDTTMSETIDTLGRGLRAAEYPPNWATVYDELRAWRHSPSRNQIRTRWARDFYTAPPRPTDTNQPGPQVEAPNDNFSPSSEGHIDQ